MHAGRHECNIENQSRPAISGCRYVTEKCGGERRNRRADGQAAVGLQQRRAILIWSFEHRSGFLWIELGLSWIAHSDSGLVSQPIRGEQKTNIGGKLPRMARRPDPVEFDRPLTEAELKERVRQLSMLSIHHVADAYRRAYEACRMEGDRLPRASAVQELVAAWKVLRRSRMRGPAPRG
jgi:hypothetical protein